MNSRNKGLEALENRKQSIDESLLYGSEKLSLNRLRPDDLPCGVVAKRSYDHRGHSIAFDHETLGDLGRIVLIDLEGDRFKLKAELYKNNSETLCNKQKVL